MDSAQFPIEQVRGVFPALATTDDPELLDFAAPEITYNVTWRMQAHKR